jgi:hypothetical protein
MTGVVDDVVVDAGGFHPVDQVGGRAEVPVGAAGRLPSTKPTVDGGQRESKAHHRDLGTGDGGLDASQQAAVL